MSDATSLSSTGRASSTEPRFAVGDAVQTRRVRPDGHTRLPAYLACLPGRIERVHGAYPLADDRARGVPRPASEALYSVVFDGVDIWGRETGRGLSVAADLWESYLEPIVS